MPEPRPLSSYTDQQVLGLPIGTRIEDPAAPSMGAFEIRARTLTHDRTWICPFLTSIPPLSMADFLQWERPRQGAALVYLPGTGWKMGDPPDTH